MARLSPGPATGWPSGEGSCRGRGAGHSYGTQGVWGFNTPEYPGGIRGRWNELTWQEAAALPGATHLGIGRQILMGLPWEQFDPHPEWVKPHHSEGSAPAVCRRRSRWP
jgi:hypothetical protein